LSYVSIAAVLLLVAIIGYREARQFQVRFAEKELRGARERLEQLVDSWQDGVERQVVTWLREAARDADPAALEAFHRENVRYFDALYTWDASGLTFPVESAAEDVAALRAVPCLAKAAELPAGTDRVAVAAAYTRCVGRGKPGSLFAASQAVQYLLEADQPRAASELLDRLAPRGTLPLSSATARRTTMRQIAKLRIQASQAHEALGRPDLAELDILELAKDMAGQDAPAFGTVKDLYLWPMKADAERVGTGGLADADDGSWWRALRRWDAYEALAGRVEEGFDPPGIDQARLLIGGNYDTPWVLYAARLGMGDLHAAVQLDQRELAALLIRERTTRENRRYVSIRDATGRVVAGAKGPVLVEVPFERMVTHLHAVITTAYATGPAEKRKEYIALLAPFVVALVVGMLALAGVIRSDRALARLIERQREFVARVSHELKTPLAGIRLMAETLEMGAYRDDAQRERFTRQIVKESERLAMRVDEVIKSSTRPLVESPTKIDLAEMLRDVGERWRLLYEQAGARLDLDVPQSCHVVGLPGLLRDALTNLVDNALKYKREDRPLVATLRLRADRRWATVEVEDNGLGVPQDKRRAIFERFARVEGPGRGKAGGHGLGLSFVADAAHAHGGSIECREGAEGGARFVLRIRRRT
jgi:signal transduction histidine kinase